jgi:7,8-dihydropterin-6-yl-methyl-4-(beta-D-ribofuranosyl)aminobenzene 5'-phosphate synthase
MKLKNYVCALVVLCALPIGGWAQVAPNNRITILYDAFGKTSEMQKDWGFAALVEYNGKKILFDTGNNAEIFAQNVKVKGVDLTKLDYVVISHRHGDHIGGLAYVLSVNPKVKIYAPKENFGVFGFSLPGNFPRSDESLPPDMRYFGGNRPEVMKFGAAWPGTNFELIDKTTEIAPGIHLIALVSDKPTTLELKELSLAIDTPEGTVVVVGCSHPGLDRIAESASAINKHIHLIAGGFHLVVAKDPDIQQIAALIHDNYKVDYVAPGHCTGEPAFNAFKKMFGDHYVYAGLGTSLELGRVAHSSPGFGLSGAVGLGPPLIRTLTQRPSAVNKKVITMLRRWRFTPATPGWHPIASKQDSLSLPG